MLTLRPHKEDTYIIKLDAMNLYGKVMRYPICQSGFKRLTEDQWQEIDWLAQREDQYTGYFVECDLEYPPELHDAHHDNPLATERVAVTPSVLSEKQGEVPRE